MTPTTILAETRRRGIALTIEADKLRYVAPPDSLDDLLRSEIREHKAAILALLADPLAERWGPGLTDDQPSIVIPTPKPTNPAKPARPSSPAPHADLTQLSPAEAIIRVLAMMGGYATLDVEGNPACHDPGGNLSDDDRAFFAESADIIRDALVSRRVAEAL